MRFVEHSSRERRNLRWSNLVPVRRKAATAPLFWVHGDGSESLLEDSLSSAQSLFFLKHQCRDGRPASFDRVEAIAAAYLTQIQFVQPEGPYFVGGYSFGGTVAFEIARQLHGGGQPVALLFMVDSLAPGSDVRKHPSGATQVASRGLAAELRRHLQSLSRLGPLEMLRYVGTRAKGRLSSRMARLRRSCHRALIHLSLATKRPLPRGAISQYLIDLYYKAIASYEPQPYPGRAIYIKSEGRPGHHAAQWGRLMLDGMEVHEIEEPTMPRSSTALLPLPGLGSSRSACALPG